jgi:formamidopyrimidine-DNA glycosylase
MPELPEVEVIRRDLEKEVVGRRIKEVEVRPGSNAMKIIRQSGRASCRERV